MEMSPRVKELRDRLLGTPAVCIERARYMTESYKQTEGQPPVMRRALALKNILEKMYVRFEGDELLAGWETSKMRAGALEAEVKIQWILDELDTVQLREYDKYQPLTEEEKIELREMVPYWKGKSLDELWAIYVPEEYHKFENTIQRGGYSRNGHQQAHAAPNMKMALEQGLVATIADLEKRMAETDISTPEGLEKYYFYKAAKITQEGVIAFANRYADLAEQTAKTETRAWRKAELEKIAENCRRVPAYPARNFWEAVQCSWFIYIACMIECWGAGISLGRVDQYLYPYYKHDIETGELTREQAYEIMCFLLTQMNGGINLQAGFVQIANAGYPVMKGLTIGGITPEGRDAVNELTYVVLDAEEAIHLTSEDVVVRIHRSNPMEYVVRACEVAKNLQGKLKFVSDETTISSIQYIGLPIEAARDYISTGCHNPGVPGVAHFNGGCNLNFALMLELALNDGILRKTGERIGPATGDPRKFKTYEELEEAFFTQYKNGVNIGSIFRNVDNMLFGEFTPCPLLSSFYNNCLERGKDIYRGGTHPYQVSVTSMSASPVVADSLAAVKKLVFDDKVITMDEMMDAIDANFEGEIGEKVLHLVKRTPKFGNDDPYVDDIAARILSRASDEIFDRRIYGNRRSTMNCSSMTVYIPYGKLLWATPDGRKAGEPLSEGGISPYQGRNISGATATLNSVAKLDQVKITNGSILNMRIASEMVKDQAGLERFAKMLRVFTENGGNLVQFNFASNETLRAAQKDPESYRDLLVRVATYSTYFVELSKMMQDSIIERNELD